MKIRVQSVTKNRTSQVCRATKKAHDNSESLNKKQQVFTKIKFITAFRKLNCSVYEMNLIPKVKPGTTKMIP
jgi:hypothetical protein